MELPTIADLIHYAGTLADRRTKLREDSDEPIPGSRMQDDPNILNAIRTSKEIAGLVSLPDANRLFALSKLANGSSSADPLWHLNEGVDRLAARIAVDRHKETNLHQIYEMSLSEFANLVTPPSTQQAIEKDENAECQSTNKLRTRYMTKDEAARKLGCPKGHKNPHLWLDRLIDKGPDNGGIHAPIGSGQQWQFVLSDFAIDQRASLQQRPNSET